MTLSAHFNIFSNGKTWQDKVLQGDALWQQVKDILSQQGVTLPATPRRPDVRLICENLTGTELRFKNPGDHSGSKEESIPAAGDKKSVMIMVQGETLAEQYKNAEALFQKYDLGNQGMSAAFVEDLKNGALTDLVAEAYGPAPFAGQAGKLKPVLWIADDGSVSDINPQSGPAAAFGARPPENQTAFRVEFPLYVQGTGTTAELIESEGMVIAVSEDYTTKAETTRPIVASVAKTYYGSHYGRIPVIKMDADGTVHEVRIPKPDNTAPAKAPALK